MIAFRHAECRARAGQRFEFRNRTALRSPQTEKEVGKPLLNRDELEAMILAEVRKHECGRGYTCDDLDEDGNRTFTIARLRASGGPVLSDAMRIAIAYAKRLRSRYGIRD